MAVAMATVANSGTKSPGDYYQRSKKKKSAFIQSYNFNIAIIRSSLVCTMYSSTHTLLLLWQTSFIQLRWTLRNLKSSEMILKGLKLRVEGNHPSAKPVERIPENTPMIHTKGLQYMEPHLSTNSAHSFVVSRQLPCLF